MSTRAMYTFKDEHDQFHVYKHHDGYPSGAVQWIESALEYSWPLPRFEANEFACAFIAACRKLYRQDSPSMPGGDTRLLHSGRWYKAAPWDIEYRYEITAYGKTLMVRAWKVNIPVPHEQDNSRPSAWQKEIFMGTLGQMKTKFSEEAA